MPEPANESVNPLPDFSRRDLLKITGFGALSLLAPRFPAVAGPFDNNDFEGLVPADKKLDPQWLRSLFERGTPSVYRGEALAKIGMPVGGIAAGQLYLGGDGRLWHWDIFNQNIGTNEAHYVAPLQPDGPAERVVEQGFALVIGGQPHRLDSNGFSNVSFLGQYPVGTVTYADASIPLVATLQAFSPFIPLNAADSSLPATILRFTIKNTSPEAVEATLVGWLQNAVNLFLPDQAPLRRNRVVRGEGGSRLDLSVQPSLAPPTNPAPDIPFEDWSEPTYQGWTAEGNAFGNGPIEKKNIPAYQGDVGGDTNRVVNTHALSPGNNSVERDTPTGRLRSRAFVIERDYLNFWLGGGNNPGQTALNLLVDGQVVRTATGQNSNQMKQRNFNVRELRGQTAAIEIVDSASGGWGHIGVGRIWQSNTPARGEDFTSLPDYGDMSLMLLGAHPEHAFASTDLSTLAGQERDEATAPHPEKLVGSLGRTFRLAPGQTTSVDFVLTWRFPNLSVEGFPNAGRHYATRFASSGAVARHIANNFNRLCAQTILWRDTWNDSTLPHWFLERTFANTSTLATSTTHRFANGRFYGWEGVGCCIGTCTHVWQYEQALGRLFPELDINLREQVDYKLGVGFHEDGMIGHRGEFAGPAVDGQAGTILRTYRDHQMSPDDAFLKRNWPQIKKAVEWMLAQDGNEDGIWEGAQHNTLDAEWFGPIAWLSGLYLAGLAAGAHMAQEVGDSAFAARCRKVLAAGQKNFVPRMWNGEYFIQVPDPTKRDRVGSYDGCEIDQVFGQSWAWQVGLGRVLPEAETKKALAALWRYNFTPDVGPYRAKYKAGRVYAVAGEGGLIMCTWPRGEKQRVSTGFDFYFNECMSGFEHQVAGHMIWEGMVERGLAIERMIHDRYHPLRRNPWNEVECGDHYARAMASYGVFLAACGYEHHGPQGYLAFAPKLSPENFKAPFTVAEGWGSYSQTATRGNFTASLTMKYGRLQLAILALTPTNASPIKKVRAFIGNRSVKVTHRMTNGRLTLSLPAGIIITAGQTLRVTAS